MLLFPEMKKKSPREFQSLFLGPIGFKVRQGKISDLNQHPILPIKIKLDIKTCHQIIH